MDSVTDPVTSSWKNIIDIHLLVVGRLALIASYLIISTWPVTIVYRCTSNIFVLDNKRFQCCMIRGKSLRLVFSKKWSLFMYKARRVGQCFFVNIWKMNQINQPILKRHQAIRTKKQLYPHGPMALMFHTMFTHQVDFNILRVFGLVS